MRSLFPFQGDTAKTGFWDTHPKWQARGIISVNNEDTMPEFTRRQMLIGTAATALAATVPFASATPVGANAPVAGHQAPGFYRYQVGSFEVTVVTDGATQFPVTDDLVLNVKKDQVAAALSASFLDKDSYFVPFNPVVIN